MNSKEIIRAMELRCPVVANGIEYAYIKEYILSVDDDGCQRRSVGLMDKNGITLVRVKSDTIKAVPSVTKPEIAIPH